MGVLDGYAIADEFRLLDAAGKLIVLGVNFRTYDASTQTWQLKWLNAFAGTWTDLGPPQLGGVRFEGRSVIYAFKEPVATHAYTRATYMSIAEDHFTWRGERSPDLASWQEFMTLQAYRVR